MYYIGVDVGGTNIATGLISRDGKMITKTSVKTLGDRAPEEITKDIYQTIETVMQETGTPLSEIGGAGLRRLCRHQGRGRCGESKRRLHRHQIGRRCEA